MQTQALVLRAAVTKETDRLVTVLTKEYGLVRAFANGSRKPKSPLHAATQPFSYGFMELTQRRDTFTITEAKAEGIFFDGLAAELSRLALANYLAALCAELAPQQESAGAFLRLMLNALHYLSKGTRPQLLLKSAVELRLLCLSGYHPNLEAPPADAHRFDCANGMITPRSVPHSLPISPAILAAMAHICESPLEKTFRFTLPESALQNLSHIAQSYAQYQTGRKFPELLYWENLLK